MIGAVGLNIALLAAGDGEDGAAVCVIGDEISGGVGGSIGFRSTAGFAIECAGQLRKDAGSELMLVTLAGMDQPLVLL